VPKSFCPRATTLPFFVLARRRLGVFLSVRDFLHRLIARLEVALPCRTGDGAHQHRADDAASLDRRHDVVRQITTVENLRMLNAVDAGRERHRRPRPDRRNAERRTTLTNPPNRTNLTNRT
jgi:hypothetical protein